MKPVLYRPASKVPVIVALALAAAIHVSALAFAPTRQPPGPTAITDIPIDVELPPDDPTPPEPQPVETPLPAPPDQPNDFTDTPEPSPRQSRNAVKPVPMTRAASPRHPAGNGRLFALNAPRPAYPYEARRYHITGSGMALLEVSAGDGSVSGAEIVQSTGSPILDGSALSAFRRWRFKPGSPSQVKIPFTFTMYGAQL